jgi:hypothetical protein
MFALQSCKGFSPNTYHFWCCTKRQCNIHYTEEDVKDLGFTLPFAMEYLTCHALKSSGQGLSDSNHTKLMVLFLASGLAATATLALVLLWWQSKVCQGNAISTDELHKETSIQEHQVNGNRSQNRQAEVVKPHRSSQMDLQAQTESSIIVSGDRTSHGKNVSSKLMVRSIQSFRSLR